MSCGTRNTTSSPFCGWTIIPTYLFLLNGKGDGGTTRSQWGQKVMEWARRRGRQSLEMGVRAQEPLWRTLPNGRRTAHARRWGGRVTGEGAREGGRGESAIQGEAGAAGARRRRGPEAPRRARRARSPDKRSPSDRDARGAGDRDARRRREGAGRQAKAALGGRGEDGHPRVRVTGRGGCRHRRRREGEGREEGRHPPAVSPDPVGPSRATSRPYPPPLGKGPRPRPRRSHSQSLLLASSSSSAWRGSGGGGHFPDGFYHSPLSERRERARRRRRDPARPTSRPALPAGLRAAAPARPRPAPGTAASPSAIGCGGRGGAGPRRQRHQLAGVCVFSG